MPKRILTLSLCHWKGLWRRVGLWPLLILALYWAVVRPGSSGGIAEASDLFGHLAAFIEDSLEFILAVLVLLGLQKWDRERALKISLKNGALPVRGCEKYLAAWLPLLAYGLLLFILSCSVFCLVLLARRPECWRDARFTEDRPGLGVTALPLGQLVDRKSGQDGEGSIILLCDLVTEEGLSIPTSLWIKAAWLDGGVRKETDIHILARRKTVIPVEPGLGNGAKLLLPETVACGNYRARLVIRDSWVRTSDLAFLPSFANLIFSMILRLALFSGLITGLGMFFSLETAVFIIALWLIPNFLFSTLGPDFISSTLRYFDANPVGSNRLERSFWWERGLLDWTRKTAFVEKAFNAAGRKPPLEFFRRGERVASPLFTPDLPLALLPVLLAILAPAFTWRKS